MFLRILFWLIDYYSKASIIYLSFSFLDLFGTTGVQYYSGFIIALVFVL
jgi:hypothetical protein